MLTVIRNDFGDICAACDWTVVNQDGSRNPNGKFLWIGDLEVSRETQGGNMIKRVILDIDSRNASAEYCYFRRNKYNDRMRLIRRDKFVSFVKGKVLT